MSLADRLSKPPLAGHPPVTHVVVASPLFKPSFYFLLLLLRPLTGLDHRPCAIPRRLGAHHCPTTVDAGQPLPSQAIRPAFSLGQLRFLYRLRLRLNTDAAIGSY
ncbi:hypothetical protein NL676_009336 [Syzygium grande]|nr:hypothetical protein NL676_009336 [Syzygium grande]